MHILTVDDPFCYEMAQVASAHCFAPLLAFTSPNFFEVKTIWTRFHRSFASMCLICKADAPPSLRADQAKAHVSSKIYSRLMTQVKSKYHPVVTSNITYSQLHVLEDKDVCSADNLLES